MKDGVNSWSLAKDEWGGAEPTQNKHDPSPNPDLLENPSNV
jgi:hypothetical protein